MVLTLWRGLLSLHLVCWVFLGPPFDDAGIQCHALTYNQSGVLSAHEEA